MGTFSDRDNAYCAMVKQEIKSMAALIEGAGYSCCIVVVSDVGSQATTQFHVSDVKPSGLRRFIAGTQYFQGRIVDAILERIDLYKQHLDARGKGDKAW